MNPPELPLPEGQRRSASVINRIVASSLRQRFLIILATFLLIGTGTWSLNRLPVEAYPDLSPPMVEIITQWPGRAAEEVERLIRTAGFEPVKAGRTEQSGRLEVGGDLHDLVVGPAAARSLIGGA